MAWHTPIWKYLPICIACSMPGMAIRAEEYTLTDKPFSYAGVQSSDQDAALGVPPGRLSGSEASGDHPSEAVPIGDVAEGTDTSTTAGPEAPIELGPPIEPVPELIKERYPNGRVKIAREITQDDYGNYINHGSWKMWDERGTLVAQGQYHEGQRTGLWNRWHRSDDAKLFAQPPYNKFTGPYISQAIFRDGQLHGNWFIYDREQRKISQLPFTDGQRHGTATWWYPNGQKMREISYRDGIIHGELRQWDTDERLVGKRTYQEGRKLAPRIEYHSDVLKKSQTMYLHAQIIMKTPDDWWNAKPAVYTTLGKNEKHGPWVSWHSSGRRRQQGKYDHDIPVGRFIWWYPNGQKALEGSYIKGKQAGKWIWWHKNGQKSTHAEYADGSPTGRWSRWSKDGKLTQAADFSRAKSEDHPLDSPRSATRSQRKGSESTVILKQ